MSSASDRLVYTCLEGGDAGRLGSPKTVRHDDSAVCTGTWYVSAQKVLAVSPERVSMAWLTKNPLDHHGMHCDGTPGSPFGIC